VIMVTLRAEWRDWPLQVVDDGGLPDMYALDEINEVVKLSEGLLRAIDAWDTTFQSTYIASDPVRSGFTETTARQNFISEGRRLAHRLKQEAGQTVAVAYAGDGSIPTEIIQ
jgi:hypothetical protein